MYGWNSVSWLDTYHLMFETLPCFWIFGVTCGVIFEYSKSILRHFLKYLDVVKLVGPSYLSCSFVACPLPSPSPQPSLLSSPMSCSTSLSAKSSMIATQSYFKDRWNMFDFITVLGSIVDALMVEFAVSDEFIFWNMQFFNSVILKFYIYLADYCWFFWTGMY